MGGKKMWGLVERLVLDRSMENSAVMTGEKKG